MSLRACPQANNVCVRLLRVAGAAILVVILLHAPVQRAAGSAPVRLGIDVWVEQRFAPLAGQRIGLITNVTGRSTDGRDTVSILAESNAVELAAIFTPEHSFFADAEGDIESGVHAATGLPMFSLYGDTRRPSSEMLAQVDALVFDIQDIGTRIYTYATTLAYAMEEAAVRGLPIVVLDRPNPLGGIAVAGPVLDEAHVSFVGYAPIALRHGMTIGELARYFNVERGIDADLTVVPVRGWTRGMWFDETGLEWVNPSPNIRNPKQALLYPSLGPLEWTTISVGRGTDEPFEWFGAPWLDGVAVATAINAASVPGVRAVPRRLTPSASVHEGELCGGVYLEVIDRNRLDSGQLLTTIAVTLEDLYPDAWERTRLVQLWGDPAIEAQLDAKTSTARILESWEPALEEFRRARARYLLYD